MLVFVNNTAMNMNAEVSLHDLTFESFEYISVSGIAGLYDSSIFKFFEGPPYCFPWWLTPFTFSGV